METIIFLVEARVDFHTGLTVPRDDPGEERRAQGYRGFERRCCKMATGTGKSTVAAMLAAWSILNKQADRGDARFSDTVLIVCPNVTIRRRLGELDPRTGDASLYRTRDLGAAGNDGGPRPGPGADQELARVRAGHAGGRRRCARREGREAGDARGKRSSSRTE